EPAWTAIGTVALTLALRGLIRATIPVTGLTVQTASEPAATSSAPNGTESSWRCVTVTGSSWLTDPSPLTTQTASSPTVTASGPEVELDATTASLRGSIFEIRLSSPSITHTAPRPTATPVGSEPSLNVATRRFVVGSIRWSASAVGTAVGFVL